MMTRDEYERRKRRLEGQLEELTALSTVSPAPRSGPRRRLPERLLHDSLRRALAMASLQRTAPRKDRRWRDCNAVRRRRDAQRREIDIRRRRRKAQRSRRDVHRDRWNVQGLQYTLHRQHS